MLSRSQLLGLYVLAFVVFFVATMPARVALGWLGLGQAISYDDVKGSLFKATLTGVAYKDMPVGNVTLEPAFFALLAGSFEGEIVISGGDTSGQFTVLEYNGSEIKIENGRLVTPVSFMSKGLPLSGTLSVTSPELTWRAGEGCVVGTFTLRTDMFAGALRALRGGELMMSGDGRCADGQLTTKLDGENAAFRLRFRRYGCRVRICWRISP